MSNEPWSELFGQNCVITGNVAKVKVLHKLYDQIANGSGVEVLDIGCVGPKPLEFREPFLPHHGLRFHLTGIDVTVSRRRGRLQRSRDGIRPWPCSKAAATTLLISSPCTPLISSSRDPSPRTRGPDIPFMRQIETVLKAGGEAFFTLDSGHWQPRFDIQDPVRLAKNIVKKSLGSLGNERHYDLPWLDREIIGACNEAGLEVIECRYFNLPPLKWIHNHLMAAEKKTPLCVFGLSSRSSLMMTWPLETKVKNYFLVIYLHVRKRSSRSTRLSNARGDAVSQGSLIAS